MVHTHVLNRESLAVGSPLTSTTGNDLATHRTRQCPELGHRRAFAGGAAAPRWRCLRLLLCNPWATGRTYRSGTCTGHEPDCRQRLPVCPTIERRARPGETGGFPLIQREPVGQAISVSTTPGSRLHLWTAFLQRTYDVSVFLTNHDVRGWESTGTSP